MRITYLDGIRLKRALIAGSRRVHKYREQLNTINVFPVADSDTGTNMAGTLKAMIAGIGRISEPNISIMSRAAADSALMGARGNSGTILSQFLYGLAEGIENRARINARTFSRIVCRAVDHTYEALAEPVEGTILTVLRAWSEKLVESSRKTSDFAHLFSESLNHAKEALRETRKKLPSLRKAKVVDAGALGIVHLIEGIVDFIEKGQIREIEQDTDLEGIEEPHLDELDDDITFRYCTECIVEGESIDQKDLRLRLAEMGDSLIVAGSSTRTKIHIHTDEPETVFRIIEDYGILSNQKADDMLKQYRAAHDTNTELALVVDSSCDLPADMLEKSCLHMVPVKVIFGERSYLDKVALSPAHYYELLRAPSDKPGGTSQPATGDFEKTFTFLTGHYRNVIYLGISEVLSGTIASARNALKRMKSGDAVQIFNTKNVTVGSGLIARRVLEWIEDGRSVEFIKAGIEDLVERTRLLVTIPSLDGLIRSGRLGKVKGLIARILNLRPLLTFDHQGRVVKLAMVRGAESGKEKIINMMRKRLGQGAESDFAVAHVDNPQIAGWFRDRIKQYFRTEREVYIVDASPALATHTGFGSAAVAYFLPSPTGRGLTTAGASLEVDVSAGYAAGDHVAAGKGPA